MANNSSGAKPKRRLKNPETVRERAVKAQAEASRPTRESKLRQVFRLILSGLGRPFAVLFSLKPFGWLGYVLAPPYLRNSWKELKLVTWPSRRESRRLTIAVMIFAIIFGVMVAGVDWGLDKIFKQVLLK